MQYVRLDVQNGIYDEKMLQQRVLVALALSAVLHACGHPKPTAADAARGAQEFVAAIPFNKTVVDATLEAPLKQSAARAPASSSKEPSPTNPMVHRFGRQLVDGRGEPLRLVGMNLGGVYLWEAWIWGGDVQLLRLPLNAESKIRSGLTELLGATQAAAFATQIQDQYITAEDFAAMARMGMNVVRVPLNHRLFEDGRGFATVDRLLDWAEAQHIYVVLDLHAAPGGQSNYFVADPGPELLWKSAELRARTVALWRSIAERYASRTSIAGYDLLNEPAPPNGTDLVSIYREIAQAIRQVDTQHLLILEGSNFAKDFSMFQGPLDANSAYSFHMYTWFGEDASKLVAEFATVARRDNLPMWCGEFGENNAEPIRASLDAIDAPANEMSGWAFWTWKKASPAKYRALVGIQVTPAWTKVIQWISAP